MVIYNCAVVQSLTLKTMDGGCVQASAIKVVEWARALESYSLLLKFLAIIELYYVCV